MPKQVTITSKKSLTSAGVKLSALILASRILGLLREMTKAAFLGTSAYADAFGIAFLIPNLFRRLFAENSISVAFIPTFRGYLENSASSGSRKETQDFISATFTIVSFLTAVFVIAGIIFTPAIAGLFYNKTSMQILPETVLLTRIMFPYLFVISTAAFFQGILNGMNIFSPSGFTPILFNGIVIAATYLLSPHTANPARAMAIGVTAGGCVQALFQLPFVLKTGWHISFTPLKNAFRNKGTRKVIALVGPTIIGMAAYQLNDIVSTALAGKAGTGIVSSLQYSLRLQELILGIFAVSIASVILPDLSGMANRQDWKGFNTMLTQAIKIIILITVPVTFYSLVSGKEIISLVYKSNRFTDESVKLTLTAFRFHMAGMCFIAMNRIIAPAFYAQGNTKKPTLAGILGFVVNIILAAVLVKPMQGGGIACALSAASLANTILLFVFLKSTPTIAVGSVVKSSLVYIIRLTVLSVIASVPVYLIRPYIIMGCTGHTRIISAGVPVVATAVIFAGIGILLLAITHDPLASTVMRKIVRKH